MRYLKWINWKSAFLLLASVASLVILAYIEIQAGFDLPASSHLGIGVYASLALILIAICLHNIKRIPKRMKVIEELEGVENVRIPFFRSGTALTYYGNDVFLRARAYDPVTKDIFSLHGRMKLLYEISTEDKGPDKDFMKEEIEELELFRKNYGLLRAERKKGETTIVTELELDLSKNHYILKGKDYETREIFMKTFITDALELSETLKGI